MWLNNIITLLFLAARCNGQETPAYEIPNWTPGVTRRHNFCAKYVAMENGKIDLRDALRGLTISVGFLRYQLDNETGAIDAKTPDISIEFLDELSRRAGFQYRNNYGVLDPPDNYTSWTDLLEFSTNVYDVSGLWYVETPERLERNIIFPEGWYDGNYIMVMKTDEKQESGFNFSFMAPFTSGLWALIAFTTVLSGLVYYVIDYIDSRIKRRPMDMGLEQSLFLTAFSFNGHYAHEPKSRSTRILVFSTGFFFLLIVACYTANLASFLVLQNREIVINDIQDAIKHDLKFCVEKGTAYDTHLQSYRIQSQNLIRTPAGSATDSSAFFGLLEGKCDIVYTTKGIFDEYRRSEMYNPNCNLAFVGRIQKLVSAGFALKDSEEYCTSLVRDVLHLHMSEIKDSGMYSKIWEDFLSKAATNTCEINSGSKVEEETYASMDIRNLSGMFGLQAMALAVALAITLLKFCQQPRSRKKAIIGDLRSSLQGNRGLNDAAIYAVHNKTTRISRLSQASPGVSTELPQHPDREKESKDVDTTCESDVAKKPWMEDYLEKGPNQSNFITNMERMDLAEKIKENNERQKELMAMMERRDKEQKILIESLLQQVQNMHERNRNMEETIHEMDAKIEKMSECCKLSSE